MSATDELRKLAKHHQDEANARRKKGREYYRHARKAEQADGQKRAAKEWQAMGDAEFRVAASQQAESERLTTMADVYDEMPDAP